MLKTPPKNKKKNIFSMTGSCRDQWHCTTEHKSPASVAHTPRLHEMPVTRFLSPLAGQLRGLQSNWLPLGMLLCFQLSNGKKKHILPFLVVVAVFFLLPSLYCVYCERENRQPPPLCDCILFTSVLLLSVETTICFLFSFAIFSPNPFFPLICFMYLLIKSLFISPALYILCSSLIHISYMQLVLHDPACLL